MPKPFELRLELEECDPIVVGGTFTDREIETLRLYLDQHEELARSKPLREGFPCGFSIKGERGSDIQVTATLPDNVTLGILLHRLRPFILQNEPASFTVVSAIVGRRVDNPHLRQFLGCQHMLYDGRDFQHAVRIVSNEVVVNSEKVLCDWLNSHEYHRDPDKRDAVDALFAIIPDNMKRAILVSMLVDKVRAIQNLASLIAVLLGKLSHLRIRSRLALD